MDPTFFVALSQIDWEAKPDIPGIAYHTDDDTGERYIFIGFNLPNGFFAEIDDATFGSLQGFRYYY